METKSCWHYEHFETGYNKDDYIFRIRDDVFIYRLFIYTKQNIVKLYKINYTWPGNYGLIGTPVFWVGPGYHHTATFNRIINYLVDKCHCSEDTLIKIEECLLKLDIFKNIVVTKVKDRSDELEYVTIEQAKKIVEEKLGHPVAIVQVIK